MSDFSCVLDDDPELGYKPPAENINVPIDSHKGNERNLRKINCNKTFCRSFLTDN